MATQRGQSHGLGRYFLVIVVFAVAAVRDAPQRVVEDPQALILIVAHGLTFFPSSCPRRCSSTFIRFHSSCWSRDARSLASSPEIVERLERGDAVVKDGELTAYLVDRLWHTARDFKRICTVAETTLIDGARGSIQFSSTFSMTGASPVQIPSPRVRCAAFSPYLVKHRSQAANHSASPCVRSGRSNPMAPPANLNQCGCHGRGDRSAGSCRRPWADPRCTASVLGSFRCRRLRHLRKLLHVLPE